MTDLLDQLKSIEEQIEDALWSFEVHDELQKAYDIYLEAEARLNSIQLGSEEPAYAEKQRLLAYCLMRQGNLLRQMEKPQEALKLSECELLAARLSGDEVMLARSLLSNGTNRVVNGELEQGLSLIEEARQLFSNGESYDYIQGLGWCWIIEADLANAGMTHKEPGEVIAIANRVLELLKPIENWPGVARAYAARAVAFEKLGNMDAATADREEQKAYEGRIQHER